MDIKHCDRVNAYVFPASFNATGIIDECRHPAVNTKNLKMSKRAVADLCFARRSDIFSQETDGITGVNFQGCIWLSNRITGAFR
ncbi:hypothetical protein LW954_17470, partial [Erwinia amylovora]|nr:hypothetical protein [Erwinia amylovora]